MAWWVLVNMLIAALLAFAAGLHYAAGNFAIAAANAVMIGVTGVNTTVYLKRCGS